MAKMYSAAVKSQVKSVCHLSKEKESTADNFQRQLRELERRVDKCFQSLDDLEEMCEQAKADIKRFELKAKQEKEIVKREAEVQAKLYSAFREMNEKVKKLSKEKEVTPLENRMPDAVQNALRYTKSARVCRFIKIGCALVFDTVAAYALFKLTNPFFLWTDRWFLTTELNIC